MQQVHPEVNIAAMESVDLSLGQSHSQTPETLSLNPAEDPQPPMYSALPNNFISADNFPTVQAGQYMSPQPLVSETDVVYPQGESSAMSSAENVSFKSGICGIHECTTNKK